MRSSVRYVQIVMEKDTALYALRYNSKQANSSTDSNQKMNAKFNYIFGSI